MIIRVRIDIVSDDDRLDVAADARRERLPDIGQLRPSRPDRMLEARPTLELTAVPVAELLRRRRWR